MTPRADAATGYVYGVYEIPDYMIEERELGSVWADERRANERARVRSIQVSGRVCVICWQLNTTGGRQILRTFRGGEVVRTTATVTDLPTGL